MLRTAIFATAACVADASGQCTSPSYDFCCQIGTKCDCTKGADDDAQCKGKSPKVPIIGKISSYKYCCQFATPCDCTKPGFMQENLVADKLSGTWEGSVPFIIDVTATFDGSAKGHISVNVKIAKDLIDCSTEDIAEDDSQITFPSVGTIGDCLGDGVRIDKKDPTKYFLIKNSDGTLTFKSDGYPALKMKKKSEIEAVTAQCSSDDQSAISGLDDNDFGDKSNKCGKGALGLTGINHDKFVSCMADSVGMSSGCAECYYTTAQYGFKNCKAACLLGWCKQGCLDCTAPAQVDLPSCTGLAAGSPTPCLESIAV